MTNKEAIQVLNMIETHGALAKAAKEKAIEALEERMKEEWIPVTYRPLTVDERIALADHYGVKYSDTEDEKAFDFTPPEDGQEILVSYEKFVAEDICCWNEYGCGLENNGDWDGITAWKPKPEPYKKEEEG